MLSEDELDIVDETGTLDELVLVDDSEVLDELVLLEEAVVLDEPVLLEDSETGTLDEAAVLDDSETGTLDELVFTDEEVVDATELVAVLPDALSAVRTTSLGSALTHLPLDASKQVVLPQLAL